jgi:excisionase family DNA binding protein
VVQSKNNDLVLDLWPDAGKLLHLSRATTYNLANQGIIPTIRMGKKILVPRVQLEKLLSGQGITQDEIQGTIDGLNTFK